MIKLVTLCVLLVISNSICQSFTAELTEKSEVKVQNESDCNKQLSSFDKALSMREFWALRMFDFWGKVDSGVLDGNTFNFGSFDGCMDFRHKVQEGDTIQGNYCLVTLQALPNLTTTENVLTGDFDWHEIGNILRSQKISLQSAVCLPASCSQEKVLQFANKHFFLKADLHGTSAHCQSIERNFKPMDYIAIVVFSFFAIVLIASTVYDISANHFGKEPNKLFIAFSAYTNGAKLFDVKKNTNPNVISCIDGLRSLSTLWIMFGHRTFFFTIDKLIPVKNPGVFRDYYNHFYSTIFTAHNLAVDTFFVMGALLLTISVLNALDKKKLNIPRMIWHRYLRYTPVLAVLVLFLDSLGDSLVLGPMDSPETACVKYWWSTLLHIQNYVNVDDLCIPHSWYLSADFQLFVLSPFLIYPAWKHGWKYLWSLPVLGLMSSVYVLVISFVKEFRLKPKNFRLLQEYRAHAYYVTHSRFGPWILGILLGYVLYTTKNKKIVISKTLNAVLWILSLIVLVVVVLLRQPFNVPGELVDLSFSAFYIAFHRVVWGIAICWVIFACYKLKTGGIVRWFLSLPQWQPIARMSLSIYLSHPIYMLAKARFNRDVLTFNLWNLFHIFSGDILVTLVISTYLYLTFEVPFMLVERYFYEKRKLQRSKIEASNQLTIAPALQNTYF